jgi:preprotein translocase subunit Sec63
MSKFDEKLALYQSEMKKLGIKFDADLLTKVTKGLGPSIYKKDAETVSGSDAKELGTVKNNFLIKKLGLPDSPKLDSAIESVVEIMGKSNRNKYRAIFYYLLVVEFGKQSIY